MIGWLIRVILGKKGLAWISPSFSDDKGEASSRRISAFYLMILYGIAHISYLYIMYTADSTVQNDLAKHLVYMMVVDVVGALFYLGLVTVQNIQMGLATLKGKDNKSDAPANTDTV